MPEDSRTASRRPRMFALMCLVLGGLAGWVLALAWTDTAPPVVAAAPTASSRCPPVVRLPATAGLDEAALREQTAAIVRDVMTSELQGSRGGEPAAIVDEPAVPSPESEEALQEGWILIEGAVGGRLWTASERDQLRALLARLDTAQQEEVLQAFAQGINRGDIEVEDGMPPI